MWLSGHSPYECQVTHTPNLLLAAVIKELSLTLLSLWNLKWIFDASPLVPEPKQSSLTYFLKEFCNGVWKISSTSIVVFHISLPVFLVCIPPWRNYTVRVWLYFGTILDIYDSTSQLLPTFFHVWHTKKIISIIYYVI